MQHEPSFDTWTIVFLIAAVQGFFIAFILFRWERGHPTGNRLLAVLLLLFSVTLTEYVFYWTHYMPLYPQVIEMSSTFPFLFGPLLLWYLRTIYEKWTPSRRDLWQLIPFVFGLVCYLPWYVLSTEHKMAIMAGQEQNPLSPSLMRAMVWLRVAHLLVYAVWCWWYIHRQAQAGATAKWARMLAGFFTGFSIAYTSYFVLVRFSFFNDEWDYLISASMTAFIYLIAYSGYVQPAVFEGFAWDEPAAPVKYRNSGLTPEASRSLLLKLNALMESEKLYRDAEISLETLAARLGASKHHVSQVINEHEATNFFDYINILRIKEAKSLLAETSRSDLHVIQAAYAVGFNNKVSFNTAFKKATGMTPTEYRRTIGQTQYN